MLKQRNQRQRALLSPASWSCLIPALFYFPRTVPLYKCLGLILRCLRRWSFGTEKIKHERSAAPLLSDAASGAHLTQTALVLQHQLLVANDVFVAEDTANAAAVGGESGELARVALLFGTVGSRE